MTPDILFSLAKNIGPCLGYEDVVEFITLYKSNPKTFFSQLYYFWSVRGHEMEDILGYTLYFQHTWCLKRVPKKEGGNSVDFQSELIVSGIQMGGLARGTVANYYP